MHESLLPMLENMAVEVTYVPHIKKDQVAELLPFYDMLMVRSKLRVTEELVAAAPRLKVVARAGAGVDNIDDGVLERHNITLLNAPEGNRDAVGEHTLGLLLTLFRKINSGDAEVRKGLWLREENRGEEIGGKTVGIIGYGNMGKAFAKRLAGFDCEVLAYDVQAVTKPFSYVKLCVLEEIQERADVLSLHIPFTKNNRHLVSEAFIDRFQNPFWLLNTARGEVVDHAALVKGLKHGKILGAALDVLENEKLSTLSLDQQKRLQFLYDHPRVVLTPHIAGWTHESYQRINEVLVQKLTAYLHALSK
ncbi:NAD(P)-dependent oxidoreductase [Rufibacter sp. DG15C]|uniref:NAD(P)-dependent oxidoreductase n=1 Tax=Rufibacter sp. DG15C TaxID=1379909 RepID=UPI000AE7290A|nr:NAD(P)-dependent oxidoreductase [Rufibacter sp. DG15C]